MRGTSKGYRKLWKVTDVLIIFIVEIVSSVCHVKTYQVVHLKYVVIVCQLCITTVAPFVKSTY